MKEVTTDRGWLEASDGPTSPVDNFIDQKLKGVGLDRSPPASPEELIRRVYYDVTGLPPGRDDIEAFVKDSSDEAYENLVERLLSDAGYGEKWASHWLDLVHFAETHGHDEDAVRDNAWLYRDYVISALNEDRVYGRFVEDQVAGDILYPEDRWSWVGVGFLAAGPWDSSSQQGIQDGTIDKRLAQMMDRDDMITNTMSTFTSLTAHCARCHDHKFDPISQEDYFALQAVFAGVDKANRSHDLDPEIRRNRHILENALDQVIRDQWPDHFINQAEADQLFRQWLNSEILQASQWAMLEGQSLATRHDSTGSQLEDGSWLLNHGQPAEQDSYLITGQSSLSTIRSIRLELLPHESLPQSGPGRQDNGNLHLSEIRVESDRNGEHSTHELLPDPRSDFNQSGWEVGKAVDGNPVTAWGIHPKVGQYHQAIFDLAQPITQAQGRTVRIHLDQLHGGKHLIGRFRLTLSEKPNPAIPSHVPSVLSRWLASEGLPESKDLTPVLMEFLRFHINRALEKLPAKKMVYTATNQFEPNGNFKPALQPRPVHVLSRGDIHKPGAEAVPGALSSLTHLPSRFQLGAEAPEGARRARLAQWLSHPRNPLTWRSIVNRIWLNYFGRGIVSTPNDFGKMGDIPTHPELLDWLASELVESGGSLKHIHKLILMSQTYRQSSQERPTGLAMDPANKFYWRAHLRLLSADEIRDSILAASNSLDRSAGGPSARHFISSKGVHVTPNLDYQGFDPGAPENLRRAIYRFRFRTVPDPFMKALNCADASQLTPTRSESVTSFQALALLHNRWVIHQSQQWADALLNHSANTRDQIVRLGAQAYGRSLNQDEIQTLSSYAQRHGLANACRMVFNSNEFLFVP